MTNPLLLRGNFYRNYYIVIVLNVLYLLLKRKKKRKKTRRKRIRRKQHVCTAIFLFHVFSENIINVIDGREGGKEEQGKG